MRRIVVAAFIILAMATPAEAKTPEPDFKVKCKDGKYAKVWLAPFRAENHCGLHTKQWLEVYSDTNDEDVLLWTIHAKVKKDPYKRFSLKANEVKVRLGRGVFCETGDLLIAVLYHPDSNWRPSYGEGCNRGSEYVGKRL